MAIDIRAGAAKYYDVYPDAPTDLEFYRERIVTRDSRVLELGCGTGRVLVPLAQHCAFIHGVDSSEAMLSICLGKLDDAGVEPERARVQVGDITEVRLVGRFDAVIAPFRVFQNLESEAEIDGFFETVREHLAPGGTCLLNVFHPNRDAEGLRKEWVSEEEYPCWETERAGQRITCHGRNARIDPERMVLYPELIYRTWASDRVIDEAVLKIAMRCYYPDEFEELILRQGFEIMERWGGYAGEAYGKGPELVLRFREAGTVRCH